MSSKKAGRAFDAKIQLPCFAKDIPGVVRLVSSQGIPLGARLPPNAATDCNEVSSKDELEQPPAAEVRPATEEQSPVASTRAKTAASVGHEAHLSAYERERAATMKRNREVMMQLGLESLDKEEATPKPKRRRGPAAPRPCAPTRKSPRQPSRPNYLETAGER
eukprot:1674505-Prymnesium_polylepis.1